MNRQRVFRYLLIALSGLGWMPTSAWSGESFSQQLVTRVVEEVVANEPNVIRFCLEGTVEIVNEDEETMVMTDRETLALIGQVLDGTPTGIGRNRIQRVQLCNDAQMKLSRIKVVHSGSLPMARVELHHRDGGKWKPFKTISVPLDPTTPQVPTVESSASQPPLRTRVPLTQPATTARFKPDKGLEGGFGIRLLVNDTAIPITSAEKLNLFLARGLADGTDFSLELVNHYPVEAAALVRLDGQARIRDANGAPLLDFVPAANNGTPGVRRIVGWGITGDLQNIEKFRLRKDDLVDEQKHHVEVQFRFASKNREELTKLEVDVPYERGFSVERGERIASPVKLESYFIGRLRETVKLAFVD